MHSSILSLAAVALAGVAHAQYDTVTYVHPDLPTTTPCSSTSSISIVDPGSLPIATPTFTPTPIDIATVTVVTTDSTVTVDCSTTISTSYVSPSCSPSWNSTSSSGPDTVVIIGTGTGPVGTGSVGTDSGSTSTGSGPMVSPPTPTIIPGISAAAAAGGPVVNGLVGAVVGLAALYL